ncbi:MAG: hypothetical protein NT007_05525 [Candidatus Kapabacteria bacterium]|nr:hypothetical protein [Candidatus Kapabacteria bacterium]
MKSINSEFLLVLLFLSISALAIAAQNKSILKNPPTEKSINFIENKGQWNPDVLYLTKLNGVNAWLTKFGVAYDYFQLYQDTTEAKSDNFIKHNRDPKPSMAPDENMKVKGHVIFMKFVGAQEYKKIDTNKLDELNDKTRSKSQGIDKQETYYNYFIGNDSTKWASYVPLYKEAYISDIYHGIDVRYYFDTDSNFLSPTQRRMKGVPYLRYDFVIHPGADLNQIKIIFEGADSINVNEHGELVLKTSLGDIRHGKLFTYQIDESKGQSLNQDLKKKNEKRTLTEIECKYFKNSDGSVGFKAGSYDKKKTLIID